MASIDYAVIAAYFVVVIGLGLRYRKRAARDLEAYFLGGKRMHWLALSMSGSVSTFDITGTMWIVTLIALFGLRSMWNHWMWGFLMAAFFLAYMGKWVRRSGVMTGAEWMRTRFGVGKAGGAARGAYTVMAVVTQVAFIGYAFQGIGKFASVYASTEKLCPYHTDNWIRDLRVESDGKYLRISQVANASPVAWVKRLVVSDQKAGVALDRLDEKPSMDLIERLSLRRGDRTVSISASRMRKLHLELPAQRVSLAEVKSDWRYRVFVLHEAAILAAAVFVITTLYVVMGGLLSVVVTDVIQTVVLTIGAVAIAVVAYTQVSPELLQQVRTAEWGSLVPKWRVPEAATFPEGYRYVLFGGLVIVWVLKGLLLNAGGPGQMYDFQRFLAAKDPRDAAKIGATWSLFLVVRWAMAMGIALLAISVTTKVADPEQFMPRVLRDYLGPGLRGLVIAGLLAAFMSTFSSTVNSAASYVVRDLWQPLVRPGASQRHLIAVSYAATVGIVAAGTVIGLSVKSIGQIFNWIMMELGAAFVIPNVLRWYWWRINGWGYAAGTLVGLAGAVAVPFLPEAQPLYVTFPLICALSIAGCLAGTFLTRPTERAVLASFFRTVRPFGCWGAVRREAGEAAGEMGARGESGLLAVVNVVLASAGIVGLYLFPMYLVGHWHGQALVCLGVAAAAAGALYFTWYRCLPPPGRDDTA